MIDAKGRFVIPGLADMHNHVRSGSFRAQQNPLTVMTVLLAFGVTMVFDPSLTTAEFSSLKQASASDSAAMPRFFGTGPIVTVKGDMLGASVGAPTPESAADARAAVKALKASTPQCPSSWAPTQGSSAS